LFSFILKHVLKNTFIVLFWTFRSGDSTARIWTIAERTRKLDSKNDPSTVLVLQHIKGTTNEKSKDKDVTTLDWNVSLMAYSYLNPWLLIVTSKYRLVFWFFTSVCIFFSPVGAFLSRIILREKEMYKDNFV